MNRTFVYLPTLVQTNTRPDLKMRKGTPPIDFKIHVDPSCLSEPADEDKENVMSTERVMSNNTVVRHESWGEEKTGDEEQIEEHANEEVEEELQHEGERPEHNADSEEDQAARDRQTRIEAQIHAAARAVIASVEMEHQNYRGAEDSVLSTRTDESYDPEPSELGYEGTEASYESDHDEFQLSHHSEQEGADSSSHHDGDIDDDVFSQSDRSKRSSLNSCPDGNSADESNIKLLTSPAVGEEAATISESDIVSRMPSGASYMQSPAESTPHTPSKVLSRPPFRTPSSVRAMQMGSPTPSIFSSPRSAKRHLPTVSRIGTPTAYSSPSKRTPTRFKTKKENPLVLLHVTVLHLQWTYSHLMSSADLPTSLHNVRDSWRLLQEKVGDTVLERGILLAHPQDSYDVLEERLLEALELPVRPRARILKCGHYMGPLDAETLSSEDEAEDYTRVEKGPDRRIEDRKWCDICGRDVRLEEVGDLERGERKFRVKVYASNGLMRAGAWDAAWREMERVDVELEPFVDTNQHYELENLALVLQHDAPPVEEEHEVPGQDDGFVDEEVIVEHVHDHTEEPEIHHAEIHHTEMHHKEMTMEEEELRDTMSDERLREIYGHDSFEVQRRTPQPRNHSRATVHTGSPDMQRRSPTPRNQSRATVDEDSLSELLLAALKVAMQDRRNVVIFILSALVLFFAIMPKTIIESAPHPRAVMENVSIPQITTSALIETSAVPVATHTVIQERTVTERVPVHVETVFEFRPKLEAPPQIQTIFEAPIKPDEPALVEVEEQTPICFPNAPMSNEPVTSQGPALVEAEVEVLETVAGVEEDLIDVELPKASVAFLEQAVVASDEETPETLVDVEIPIDSLESLEPLEVEPEVELPESIADVQLPKDAIAPVDPAVFAEPEDEAELLNTQHEE